MGTRMRWKRKKKRKNILESLRIGNLSLTKSIFLLVSALLIISYLVTNSEKVFTSQTARQTSITRMDSSNVEVSSKKINLDVWDKILSNVTGISNTKWTIHKDGRIKITFPYARKDKNGKIVEDGVNTLLINPEFSSKMSVEQILRRNIRGARSRTEKGYGYISMDEKNIVIQREGIETKIRKDSKRWDMSHRLNRSFEVKQRGEFNEKGEMIIQNE